MEFGITGEAFLTRSVVGRSLPPDHMTTYPATIQPLIYAELKCVLAAPIFDANDENGPLLGILAFDSSESLATMRFGTREVKDIAQSWADIVSDILSV
jgi:hypothetical protein